MASITESQQQFAPGERVELFKLDLTLLGGSLYYWTSNVTAAGDQVLFGGQLYTPIPIESEGFERSSKGPFPTPKLRVSNVTKALSALVASWGDCVGAKVTRTITFKRFLDGEPDASGNQHLPDEIYKVERKSHQGRTHVEFELSAAIDQEGRMLPGRQALRDYCPWVYRRWNGSSFDYESGSHGCPYSGTGYFTTEGHVTTAANDKCGKQLTDCEKRFGNADLPFGGFPGMAQY